MTPKEVRLIKGLSMDKFSFLLGMTTNTYCLKETGKSKFTFQEMKKIAELGGLSIDDMLETKGE